MKKTVQLTILKNESGFFSVDTPETVLGRQWDNHSTNIEVVRPNGFYDSIRLTMDIYKFDQILTIYDTSVSEEAEALYYDGLRGIDSIEVKEEKLSLANHITRFENIRIKFIFTDILTGVIKNTETKDFKFLKSEKPVDFAGYDHCPITEKKCYRDSYIEEAPNDGKGYLRQDGGWEEYIPDGSGLADAPKDGKQYFRQNGLWEEYLPDGSGLEDVPQNGKQYLRRDGAWEEYIPDGNGLAEAPVDGKSYIRKNGGWAELVQNNGAGGSEGALITDERSAVVPLGDMPVPGTIYAVRRAEVEMEQTDFCDYAMAPLILSQSIIGGETSGITLEDLQRMFHNQIQDVRITAEIDMGGEAISVALQASQIAYFSQASGNEEMFMWSYLGTLPGEGGALSTALYTTMAQSDGENLQFDFKVSALGAASESQGAAASGIQIVENLSEEPWRVPIGTKTVALNDYQSGNRIPRGTVAEIRQSANYQSINFSDSNAYYRYIDFQNGLTYPDSDILVFTNGSKFYFQNNNLYFSRSGENSLIAENGSLRTELKRERINGVEYVYYDPGNHEQLNIAMCNTEAVAVLGWRSVNSYQSWETYKNQKGDTVGLVIGGNSGKRTTFTVSSNQWTGGTNLFTYHFGHAAMIPNPDSVEVCLPSPTSQNNASAFYSAGLYIAELSQYAVTIGAVNYPTSDITISLKGLE